MLGSRYGGRFTFQLSRFWCKRHDHKLQTRVLNCNFWFVLVRGACANGKFGPGAAERLDNLRTTYLLAFDDEYYNVPVENVLLYPKFTNSESQETVLRVLNSRDPLDWSRYITCGRVMHIRGQEGSAVYTTFAVS